MIFSPNSFWRWPLYLLYALLVVVLFLYLRFPGQQFKTFCTQSMTRQFPGYEGSIESLRYQFPLTLVATNLQLASNNQAAQEIFTIEQLTLTPTLMSFKDPASNFLITITAYGGTHQADLVLDRGRNTFSLANIEINAFDLAKLQWLKTQTGRAITGLLTAQGSYAGQLGQEISKGTGQGTITITAGSFALLEPILSLKNIDLDKGEAQVKLQEQKLVLGKGKLKGKELEGTFGGQLVELSAPFAAIQLNLTGTLMPLPDLVKKSGQAQPLLPKLQKNKAGLPFHLQGTIGKPRFLFDS
jgi:type II secretion system protein N